MPRYSLRALIAIVAAFSVFFLLVSLGLRGHVWAFALSLSICFVGVAFVVYAAFFVIAWIAIRFAGRPVAMVDDDVITPELIQQDDEATA